nr:hypothetical protein [Tanacetum cinerariifolium]
MTDKRDKISVVVIIADFVAAGNLFGCIVLRSVDTSHSAFCIMQKCVDLKSIGTRLQIVFAFNVEHVKGFSLEGVADVLAEHDATRSKNGEDNHDSGTGVRRQAPFARECTYPDSMKCKLLYFKGTEGVVELTQWTVGHDVAYVMTWKNLKNMMTDKYCPRGEIKKLEVEMWNLKVKGTDVVSYNQRFQELALMCARMFPEESDKIEKYVGGLPDMIHGSVMESKPKTLQDETKFATELMDKKINTLAKRQA